MSIETLLEAAKFLELQAQQQQKARGTERDKVKDELKEKRRLEQLAEQKNCIYYKLSANQVHHVPQRGGAPHQRHLAPPSPCLPPSSMPITVIPIPVVTPNPTGSPPVPAATLSPPGGSAAASTANPTPLMQKQPSHPPLITRTSSNTLQELAAPLQRYPGSIVSPPHQQTLLPQAGPPLQQASLQNGPISRGSSPPGDGRHQDNKKRPGGAGTREVHNKLEKNRRAHLKECFETLKKNIPNIEEKKTSNLSVLRSALRYIQTLKRKEKEYEHDMERLAREKIATQQHLAEKNDLSQWMDVTEIERVLRQTVQPEEDQASTSTASEGEDMEDDLEDEPAARTSPALATVPQATMPERQTAAAAPNPPPATSSSSSATQSTSVPNKPAHPQPVQPPTLAATTASSPGTPPQPLVPTQSPGVPAPSIHPTVIAHASVSHPSVIQAVNHVIQGGGPKRMAHLAPPSTGTVQLPAGHPSISHITVHPLAHLSQHLPTLYPQPVAVTQPAVVGHLARTLSHAHPQVNAAAPVQPAAAIIAKQAAMSTQMVAHHPQLMGQTLLNPVTMVTMPSFPISTLKLA
uniref:Max-binding protein MNT n=1 Tax=Tetraodon nigroviridis TaxID=99883 RepID=H3CJV9_TETNG